MKKIFNILILSAVLVGATSCEKYLDINENPNNPTEIPAELVLPQALVGTGSVVNTYNVSIADLGGQFANAGGFGGFGAVVTYNYTSSNFTGMWSSSYDNLEDYQYIINESAADPGQVYSNSIARIMKAFVFSKLVDQYNDVPYSQALRGSEFLTPKFDKAEDIYQDLVKELNESIAAITAGQSGTNIASVETTRDPMFKGDMNNWKRFANSVKLRLLIKMAGVPATQAFATAQFSSFNTGVGFLTDDATVNPGYLQQSGRQNPTWNSLAFNGNPPDDRALTSRLPSKFIYSFYSGGKLNDSYRGSVIYRSFPNTPINQLGDETAGVPQAPSGTTAFTTAASYTATGLGAAKGPTQDAPIMIKAESDLLQAEAYARGYLTGNDATAFNAGITASFRYLYKSSANSKQVANIVDPAKDVNADVAGYKTANPTSFLVNYNLATSLAQKIEAIITQKYIALNLISSDEAYNEFKRTGYPTIVNGSLDPLATFASRQSGSTRPDKLVSRVLYPQSEYNLNPENTPSGIGLFTSRIFWDLN